MNAARSREGSVLVVIVFLCTALWLAGSRAELLWEKVQQRERERDLAQRLVRIQRALDETGRRLGRAPTDVTEITIQAPPILPHLPLDPFTGARDWAVAPGAEGHPVVRSTSTRRGLDGTRVCAWYAAPAGSTWTIRGREATP